MAVHCYIGAAGELIRNGQLNDQLTEHQTKQRRWSTNRRIDIVAQFYFENVIKITSSKLMASAEKLVSCVDGLK